LSSWATQRTGCSPHHGQGANTSIEDAFVLAALLAESAVGAYEPLAHYQTLRRARTRKTQRSSWVTNALLHLHDGLAIAERDAAVARVPDDFAWIHDYDVQQALQDGVRRP
jgi:salicylate hydroxylase